MASGTRKEHNGNSRGARYVRVMMGLLMAAVAAAAPLWLNSDTLSDYTRKAAIFSARLQTPAAQPAQGLVSKEAEETAPPEGEVVEPVATTAEEATTAAPTTTTTTTAPTQPPEGRKPISEVQLGSTKLKSGNVSVKNGTSYSIDIDKVLKEKPDCKIKLNAGYQVLIMHTHTTECYAEDSSGSYDPNYSPRTTDKSQSVIALGDVIADKLEAAGIRTLHATTVHDYPQYNGSYDRALETISGYLEQHPSIEMVIDVHRDAMTQDDGTKLKPTAVINGKKAAQVMIITGCDADGTLYFPEWRKNLRMAMQLQKKVADNYSGLMRPLYFAPFRYNMHMTPNSLLLEFGTDANTLEEALYSAELVGTQLAELLKGYEV